MGERGDDPMAGTDGGGPPFGVLPRPPLFGGPTTDGLQAVLACDAAGHVTFVSEAAEELYGCAAEEAAGCPIDAVVTWDLEPDHIRDLTVGGARVTPWSGEVWARRPDGRSIPVHLTVTPFVVDDERVATITVAVDVSERHAVQRRLVHRSTHDDLTGLPTRRRFCEILERTIAGHDHRRGPVSIVVLDLDDFRLVNDGFGHLAGDLVLEASAAALHEAMHPGDVLARLSGASFGICCHHGGEAEARPYADHLREAVAEPITIDGAEVRMRSSAGVAVVGTPDEGSAAVLQRADLALSRAKEAGRECTWVYDDALRVRMQRHLDLEAVLRRVIASGEVTLGFQPIVGFADGQVKGAEALLRLVDHQGRPIPALEIVTLAERRGLIGDLGLLILEEACRQAARWQAAEPERTLGVAVNVSARQLDDPDLAAKVGRVLAATGLDPARLTLEMTETALMDDSARSASQLAKLKMGGVRLSADDFGTGYSSLAYLKRFPLDVIKADLSFVAGLPDSPEDVAVIGAIMGVAGALGLQVVAEGVETDRQLESLRSLGCELGQGRWWSWAVPAEDFLAQVRAVEGAFEPRIAGNEDDGSLVASGAQSIDELGLDSAYRMLAHEIRTPLTVITGYASMLQSDPSLAAVDDHVSEVATHIRSAAERIDRLVAGIDDAHQLDQGRLLLEVAPLDLTALATKVADELIARDLGPIQVQELLIGPASVSGDGTLLGQVIDNLLSNAVKFSPPGSAVLALVGRRGRWIELAVHDEGPGIPAEGLGLAFRKYGRLDRSVPGSGIGLYLARGIARAHGGEVTYRHRRDRTGSVFTLRLPFAPADATGAPR